MRSSYDGMHDFHDWIASMKPTTRAPLGHIWVRWEGCYVPETWKWANWVDEMEFLTSFENLAHSEVPSIDREKLVVRFRQGKLVMGSGWLAGCYQLNFGEAGSSLSDGWVSSARALGRWRNEESWRPSAHGENFWVRDEDECQEQDGKTEN
ncbi:hypothetical protein CBER1_03655 [Cercospora berteroae]|uniref:Uncharacterized protein n=1 Tax=Cercospora berteroae TaxID=357750 RepID=A0A2S6CLL7_9PEZI|nr:hypothetical protein CBER1_03655 [Cercospora berteroae]